MTSLLEPNGHTSKEVLTIASAMDYQGDPKDKYMDAGENMRHWASIRFAQMTLFIAITAGILAGLFQSSSTLSGTARITLKISGSVVTLVFWLLDERAIAYWRHFRGRAIELEEALGFQQHARAPAARILSSANAIRVLYLTILLFWMVALIWVRETIIGMTINWRLLYVVYVMRDDTIRLISARKVTKAERKRYEDQ